MNEPIKENPGDRDNIGPCKREREIKGGERRGKFGGLLVIEKLEQKRKEKTKV